MLASLANEMLFAEQNLGVISESALLPAENSVLEVLTDEGQRVLYCCAQKSDQVNFDLFAEGSGDRPLLSVGFTPGTDRYNLPGSEKGDNAEEAALLSMFFLEKLLCMLNQPGLVERRDRKTDKRVVREAIREGYEAPTWHECRIYPGAHGGYASSGTSGDSVNHRPMHYVRRYFRPSSQTWVDGYWRGDATLGVHMKWYSPRPPKQDGERL